MSWAAVYENRGWRITMEYRVHPKTGDKISVIGIGTGPIFEAPER